MPVLGADNGTAVVGNEASAAALRHRNFLTLVHYAGDSQGFAKWARLSSDSVAAWELDADSVTETRAALIEERLHLPEGWLSLETPKPLDLSLTAAEVDPVDDPDTLLKTRRENLQLLVNKVRSKIALAPLTDIAPSNLSKVFKKDFTDYIARKIETNMGLPEGWLDSPHDAETWESTVPDEVVEKLNKTASERPGPGAPPRKSGSTPDGRTAPAHGHSSAPRHHGVVFGPDWPPLSRALVEKTAELIDSKRLTEDVAYALFGQLLQLERGVQPNLPTNLPSVPGAVAPPAAVQPASPAAGTAAPVEHSHAA